MNKPQNLKFSPLILAIPLYLVLGLWFVFWFEMKFGYNFNKYGIFPRSLKGLRGIVFSPFIHSDIKHLYHNSIPLFVLLLALLYFYRHIALKILIYGTLLSGFLTWIYARRSYHIGASGVIYLLFSFLFFSGVFRKNVRLIAVALAVIFLYGSMIWYILPVKEGVSWEGHLSGFLIGLIFAFFYRKKGLQKFKYSWERTDYQPDDFDLLFDEDGNFNPPPKEDDAI
ncbi:MAG: rhomboid family intramembrane serine protease [Flavobacteriaceae bacterium]|nr:rhomboid family intramembrane serine protease [Flavobacteriaceae bacterium]